MPDFSIEDRHRTAGRRIVAGVDEVGRGPLAGPVVAAAIVLDPARCPDGLDDSKKLTAERRVALDAALRDAAAIGVGLASVAEIETLNIYHASHAAMCRAVDALPVAPDFLLVDGNKLPQGLPCAAEPVVKGDALSLSIAAASIVAKVVRDRLMLELAQHFPGYGWETNMGYGTPAHLEGLKRHGVTPHHRRGFKPVHEILLQADFALDPVK